MTMHVAFRPPVAAELAEAYRWYEERQPRLGDDFMACFRVAVDELSLFGRRR